MRKALFFALCLCGCSSFRSDQIETRPDGSRVEQHQKITTFWDSKSDIARLRASTTDKTQGLTVGSISQESTSTNINDLVGTVVSAAVQGAVKAAVPVKP